MAAEYDLDSKIFKDWPTRVIKSCAARPAIHYCFPQNCGCSSVVEHLLAKEDVASSSLVTRSSPERLSGLERCAVASANADRPETAKLPLAGRGQNRFGWNAHVTVKDITRGNSADGERKSSSPSQTFLESSTGSAPKRAGEACALPNHVSVAKGSPASLAKGA